jgi:hypothetical protein
VFDLHGQKSFAVMLYPNPKKSSLRPLGTRTFTHIKAFFLLYLPGHIFVHKRNGIVRRYLVPRMNAIKFV